MEGRLTAWTIGLLLFMAEANLGSAGSLASYWGEPKNGKPLADACASGHYDILMLAFFDNFGSGQTPHQTVCEAHPDSCQSLVSDVQKCQENGQKVLLSMGGGGGTYGFNSSQDAENVAHYLWDNYLGGSSDSSPMGAVKLDGIDLDIEMGGSEYYTDLISSLRRIGREQNYKTLYITAAPECSFPDFNLGPGDGTVLSSGVDMIFIQFYNNPYCEYEGDFEGGLDQLLDTWNQWTGNLSSTRVFLGLPASPDAASSGYVDHDTLLQDILPHIKTASNYGGVMLWNVFEDQQNKNYSVRIRSSV
ncbi:hypothetical protein R1flu_022339 [Riccia fluitans]|uniref:chitinase n=1 Tax=Riccia fluitans TaxID=41844 RepID=A0ABD1ZRW6_9MARC